MTRPTHLASLIRSTALAVIAAAFLCTIATGVSQAAKKSPLIDAMKTELARSMQGLTAKGDPPPYFISYYVNETYRTSLSVSYGAVNGRTESHDRKLDIDVRVGH